ncbi:MAG: NAD(P)/FAD-dependent oxidoreductase [Chitinophagaceae bacterium]|nr:NAD(P)/FAD-dependent oxidoreductase [Chitinophagaceae bacterium]
MQHNIKEKKKVLIIGGGFAGVEFAKKLDKNHFEIILIDKLNHHQFQPLFYQVATSQIEPSSISFPLRYIFKDNKNIQIRLAEVKEIIPSLNQISTSIGIFSYDYLVIATGCKTNFFNNKSIEANSFTLKTTYDAISIRNQIISVFEKVLSASENDLDSLLNLVIVGAGPTGVELAGAFAEIKKFVLPKDYPGIDFSKFTIYLVEGSKKTLSSMSEASSKTSLSYLQNMGVTIMTETFVKDYDGKVAMLSNGKSIPTATLIWAAGVKGNKLKGLPDDIWVANDRVLVDRFNKVQGFDTIFAIGDIAYMTTEKYPKAHPQIANVAINQAKLLSRNLVNILHNKSCIQYEYKDLGSMATIGKNKAVVDLAFGKFKGYFAWLIWMFLHLMLILTVRNKLIIFINWAWAYMTNNSSLRLILKSDKVDKSNN